MPTYQIQRAPSRGSILIERLLGDALGGFVQQQFSERSADKDLERQKDLIRFKEENKPLEELPLSKLEERNERMAGDLEKAREKALISGNVDELKAIDKAEKDINLLRDTLKRKYLEKTEADIDTSLKQREREAQIKEREARAKYYGTERVTSATVDRELRLRKLGQMDLAGLRSELGDVQREISRYETNFLDVPNELLDQRAEVMQQIAELKKKQGFKQPSPFGPKSAPKAPLKGKSDDDLLNTLIK